MVKIGIWKYNIVIGKAKVVVTKRRCFYGIIAGIGGKCSFYDRIGVVFLTEKLFSFMIFFTVDYYVGIYVFVKETLRNAV